jgi:hypothetical protein
MVVVNRTEKRVFSIFQQGHDALGGLLVFGERADEPLISYNEMAKRFKK